MKIDSLDKTIVASYKDEIKPDEIKSVISGIMYVGNEFLDTNDLQPGDIFKIGGDYYINIRPICDTVISRNGCDGEFYAIKGSQLREKDIKERYIGGHLDSIVERQDEVILYGVDGKDFYRFSFKKVYIKKFIDERDKRKCRLISPYINHVQQKYSSYVGRFGLPRIPSEIINDFLPKEEAKGEGPV